MDFAHPIFKAINVSPSCTTSDIHKVLSNMPNFPVFLLNFPLLFPVFFAPFFSIIFLSR